MRTFGIDGYAHRSALAVAGVTVAVLPCGVDLAYPLAHAGLFRSIREQGAVVSEWPPGRMPTRHGIRAADRTSQALISTVICGAPSCSPTEMVFRILLFKLFNSEATWRLLELCRVSFLAALSQETSAPGLHLCSSTETLRGPAKHISGGI